MIIYTQNISINIMNFTIQKSFFNIDNKYYPNEYNNGKILINKIIENWSKVLLQYTNKKLTFEYFTDYMINVLNIKELRIDIPNMFIKISTMISIMSDENKNENFNNYITDLCAAHIHILRKLYNTCIYNEIHILKLKINDIFDKCNIFINNINPLIYTSIYSENMINNTYSGYIVNGHFSHYYDVCGPILITIYNKSVAGYYNYGHISQIYIKMDPVILYTDELCYKDKTDIKFVDINNIIIKTPICDFKYPKNNDEFDIIKNKINEFIDQIDKYIDQ